MSHAPHICTNCGLTIRPDEEEVEVDVTAMQARRKAAGLRTTGWATKGYRHPTYEVCAAAEWRAARW